jgi:hypothetical protein
MFRLARSDGRETAVLMAGRVDIIRNFSGLSGTGHGRNRRRRTAIEAL